MKIKVDNIVNIEVIKSQKSITGIASDINLSRVQLRKILDKPEMEMKYILAIGKSIRFDFGKYFPELRTEFLDKMVQDPQANYGNMGNFELRNEIIDISAKYIKLLEDHVQLLKNCNENKA
jgi:hypothetical protein